MTKLDRLIENTMADDVLARLKTFEGAGHEAVKARDQRLRAEADKVAAPSWPERTRR